MMHFSCKTVLIPIDFSETSMLAVRHAAFLAQYQKSTLYVLHVINVNFGSIELFVPVIDFNTQHKLEEKAWERLKDLTQEISNEFQIEVVPELRNGSASKHIVEFGKQVQADLIVMGTHGYSPFEELLIGSTALKVFIKAPCPVIAMRQHEVKKGYTHLLMPVDLSPHSGQKALYTMELAKSYGATVHLLGLLHEHESSELAALKALMAQIEAMAQKLNVKVIRSISTQVTNRAKATLDYAKQHPVDLISIMTDQEAEWSGFFLGPYSQQIIHHSPIPVLAIKPLDLHDGQESGFYSASVGF